MPLGLSCHSGCDVDVDPQVIALAVQNRPAVQAEAQGKKLRLVDGPSLPYVEGSTIDYVDDLQGAGFKVDNPNVIAACGCGSSFRVAEEEEVSAV